MAYNSSDFEKIQEIFATKEADNRTRTDLSTKSATLVSNPKYAHMRVKNLDVKPNVFKYITPKVLKAGTVLALQVGIIVGGALLIANNPSKDVPDTQPSVSAQANVEETPSDRFDATLNAASREDVTDRVIKLDDCDLDRYSVIIRKATDNMEDNVTALSSQFDDCSIENRVVSSNADVVSAINDIKVENADKKILVINLDGEFNRTDTDIVLMTNYENKEDGLADNLAIAFNNYQTNRSRIVAGKLDEYSGERKAVSTEEEIKNSGNSDVSCLTFALNGDCVDSENLAKFITESLVKVASLDEHRDLIHRVEFGDTAGGLSNYQLPEGRILEHDIAVVSKDVPAELTREYDADISKPIQY